MRALLAAAICLCVLVSTLGSAQQPQRRIEARASATMVADQRGDFVRIETNLPNGMEVLVQIQKLGTSYYAEARASVAGGQVLAGPFSNQGRRLEPGFYALGMVSASPMLQPPAVQQAIGEGARNLTGPLMRQLVPDAAFGTSVRLWQVHEFCPPHARFCALPVQRN